MDNELFLGLCTFPFCRGFGAGARHPEKEIFLYGTKLHKVKRALRSHIVNCHGRMFDFLDIILIKVL